MSQTYEEAFMAGFNGTSGAKTAEETEMPVLNKALDNLGLLEEAPAEEEIEMPILKQALENLGLTEEAPGGGEERVEASSMLEALAIKHGPAVIAEREKVAALEKEGKKSTFILGKGTGGVKDKGGLTEKIRSFTSKHKGKFKVGGAAAGGALAGGILGRATKGDKKKDKKGK